MKKNDVLTINRDSKKPPMIMEIDNTRIDKAFITGEVKTADDELWEFEVINISSSGKYTIRLTEKIH